MEEKFKKVAVAGLGLMGGSIGLALKRRQAAERIVGIDIDENAARTALELGAVDEIISDFKEGFQDTEILVLAVHLDAIEDVLVSLKPYLPPDCIVTDIASVKGRAIEVVKNLLPPEVVFIGGHPMTGSEDSGIENADTFLYENAIYVLTPSGDEPHDSLEKLKRFIDILGAKPLILDPGRHDFLVAMVSHMPHLVASTLNLAVSETESSDEAFALAAGGFRDTTRVASSHPEMWAGICVNNSFSLLKAISIFQDRLHRIESLIKEKNKELLKEELDKAKKARDSIPNRPGLLPRVYEIFVTLPDRPGEIGRIGTLLGDRDVNIAEIEILRVREGEGGTMRLAFNKEEGAIRGQKVLEEEGYRVRRRA